MSEQEDESKIEEQRRELIVLKVTFFGTTTLLFDDGKDQILFDAHVTRPSLGKYIRGAKESTNTDLCDRIIQMHRIDRLRAIFISHTHHDHVMDAPYIAKKAAQRYSEVRPREMLPWEVTFLRKT